MRKNLQNINGNRTRFRATIERFGSKKNYHGYPERTILFRDVVFVDNLESATDHLWFTVGKTIAALMLKPGDVVEFDARVVAYAKGYVNHRKYLDEREIDYKLNRPTNFKKLEAECTVVSSN